MLRTRALLLLYSPQSDHGFGQRRTNAEGAKMALLGSKRKQKIT